MLKRNQELRILLCIYASYEAIRIVFIKSAVFQYKANDVTFNFIILEDHQHYFKRAFI